MNKLVSEQIKEDAISLAKTLPLSVDEIELALRNARMQNVAISPKLFRCCYHCHAALGEEPSAFGVVLTAKAVLRIVSRIAV